MFGYMIIKKKEFDNLLDVRRYLLELIKEQNTELNMLRHKNNQLGKELNDMTYQLTYEREASKCKPST